jgi:hypothetical protein
MIQPLAKLRFVERYCSPKDGWWVFVDIDPSEEGRTGSPRRTERAKFRQRLMLEQAPLAIHHLKALGAFVGQRKHHWNSQFNGQLLLPPGDRDILAVNTDRGILLVAEVEGDSAGQPEGKMYKALGQLVCAVTEMQIPNFERFFSLVVWGDEMAAHLERAQAIQQLGVSGLVIGESSDEDRWLFGKSWITTEHE